MEQRGLNNTQLAREIGTSHVAVGNFLDGQLPKSEHLYRLAKFFDVSMEWLLGMDDIATQRFQKALEDARLAVEKAAPKTRAEAKQQFEHEFQLRWQPQLRINTALEKLADLERDMTTRIQETRAILIGAALRPESPPGLSAAQQQQRVDAADVALTRAVAAEPGLSPIAASPGDKSAAPGRPARQEKGAQRTSPAKAPSARDAA
jgi:transcriptional regulator with XRE-family HTH domain